MLGDGVPKNFELRQGRKQPKNLYLHSPAYPEGELVGQVQLTWVAEQICHTWNLHRESMVARKLAEQIATVEQEFEDDGDDAS